MGIRVMVDWCGSPIRARVEAQMGVFVAVVMDKGWHYPSELSGGI